MESLGVCLGRLGQPWQRLAFGLGHQAQLEAGELFELADVGKHRAVVRALVVDEGNGGDWFTGFGHSAHSLQLDVVNVYPRSLYAQIDRSGMMHCSSKAIDETAPKRPVWWRRTPPDPGAGVAVELGGGDVGHIREILGVG